MTVIFFVGTSLNIVLMLWLSNGMERGVSGKRQDADDVDHS